MYGSTKKPYDPLVIGLHGQINYDIVRDDKYVQQIINNLYRIEFHRAMDNVNNNAGVSLTDYATSDGQFYIERKMGGAKPFGSIRYNIYVLNDGAKTITEKPRENFTMYMLIVHVRDFDLSTGFEFYKPDVRSEILDDRNFEYVDLKELSELFLFSAENLYSGADTKTSTPFDIGGYPFGIRVIEAATRAIYAARGRSSKYFQVPTEDGRVDINFSYSIDVSGIVLKFSITDAAGMKHVVMFVGQDFALLDKIIHTDSDVEKLVELINQIPLT